jgi:hypothetical protein
LKPSGEGRSVVIHDFTRVDSQLIVFVVSFLLASLLKGTPGTTQRREKMITETFLRTHERWVKYLTGLTASQFWEMFSRIEANFEAYERQRHERPGRKRAVGAGRPYAVPLLLRVVALITYLRLHLPQEFIGMWFGMDQVQISRDLRRLLPLIRQHVPAPQVLEPVPEEERPVEPIEALRQAFGEEGVALLDATEQPINRPKDAERQKAFYSGKKKRHTVKTQIVTNGAGEIVAITPPVPGKTADIKLAERSRVVERLPEGIDTYADKGYQGLDKHVPPKKSTADGDSDATETVLRLRVHTPTKKPKGGELTPEQKERNRAIGRVRMGVEHAIARAKNWHILADRFRCHLDMYEEAFRTVCGFANLQVRERRLATVAA